MGRPESQSSSATSSKEAESEAPGVQIGNSSSGESPSSGLDELRLPCPHPVAVALDGVDLAVVRDGAERLGQRPGRERVGGEARVDDRELGLEALVREVRVERLELRGGEHALVDDGPGGQRREVHAELVLGALADPPGAGIELVALEGFPGAGGEERLREVRHAGPGHGPDQVGHDRDFAPAEDRQALVRGEAFDAGPGGVGFALLGGQESGSHDVLAGGGKFEVRDCAEEFVRHLHEEAGAVAGTFIGAHGAAVFEVAQGGQGGVDDVVARLAAERGDDGQAAGVLLVLRVVESGSGRNRREAREG